jgi:hypothetical protein
MVRAGDGWRVIRGSDSTAIGLSADVEWRALAAVSVNWAKGAANGGSFGWRGGSQGRAQRVHLEP